VWRLIASVVIVFVMIVVGTAIVGFVAGPPPVSLLTIVIGEVITGVIALNVAVRTTGVPASKPAAWTIAPIVAFYVWLLWKHWAASGQVGWASLITASALVVGIGLAWFELREA
jgi:hypothetical protein